jgi:hypothetical protein
MMLGDQLGLLEDPVNALGAKLISFDVGDMPQAEFSAGFDSAFFRPKNDDLHVGPQALQSRTALRWVMPMWPRQGFGAAKRASAVGSAQKCKITLVVYNAYVYI